MATERDTSKNFSRGTPSPETVEAAAEFKQHRKEVKDKPPAELTPFQKGMQSGGPGINPLPDGPMNDD